MSRQRKPRDPSLYDIEAGKRIAALFERAKVELGFETNEELWRYLGINRSAPQVWMRGESPPSSHVGSRIAPKLGMTYAELVAVWEGRQPEMSPSLVISALEWAIAQIRRGQMSTRVRAVETPDPTKVDAIEKAARNAPRRRSGQPGERTTGSR